jgi:Holliday junction DNA helicase RuvA
MIARLTGRIEDLKPAEVIMDVQGVGYHVFIPFSTYEKILSLERASLHIHTIHKEDQFRLFGFYTELEKRIFAVLLEVSGIGPSMALSVLSGMGIDEFIGAVRSGNADLLTKIPGIGKSKADKLVFELSRKAKKFEGLGVSRDAGGTVRRDAVEALASLGFDEKKVSQVVGEIMKESPDITLEKAVKESLKPCRHDSLLIPLSTTPCARQRSRRCRFSVFGRVFGPGNDGDVQRFGHGARPDCSPALR